MASKRPTTIAETSARPRARPSPICASCTRSSRVSRRTPKRRSSGELPSSWSPGFCSPSPRARPTAASLPRRRRSRPFVRNWTSTSRRRTPSSSLRRARAGGSGSQDRGVLSPERARTCGRRFLVTFRPSRASTLPRPLRSPRDTRRPPEARRPACWRAGCGRSARRGRGRRPPSRRCAPRTRACAPTSSSDAPSDCSAPSILSIAKCVCAAGSVPPIARSPSVAVVPDTWMRLPCRTARAETGHAFPRRAAQAEHAAVGAGAAPRTAPGTTPRDDSDRLTP